MATAPRQQPAQVLEKGNVVFCYRPKPGIAQPQKSDDVGQTSLILLPDDQAHHQNRLVSFPDGVFPLIMPNQSLPEERGWAIVTTVGQDPRDVVDALLRGTPAPTAQTNAPSQVAPRVAATGRYAIADTVNHVNLAYALAEPRQLGWAQKTLLLDREGVYRLRVVEPAMPTPFPVLGSPSYPQSLSEQFDGHTSIPAEPIDFLDYQWTRLFFVGTETDVKATLGITLDRSTENQAEKDALSRLHSSAQQIKHSAHVDIFEPLQTGRLA